MSKHFSRAEWEFSQTAVRHGKTNIMPDRYWTVNAERHNQTVLEPLRAYLSEVMGREVPVFVRSGYRSPWLNRKVKGSRRSAHMEALASDIVANGYGAAYHLAQAVAQAEVLFDQLILEFGRWVHVSSPRRGAAARRQILTAYKISWNRTRYREGIVMVRSPHPIKRFFIGDLVYEY